MKSSELYEDWGLPYIIIGSGVLIAREQALRVIELLYEKGFYFLGYDAFTVFPDGTRQPHMEFNASFSRERQITFMEAIETINEDPSEVTHYEFYFRPQA
ncbi:hypothetical protein NQU96_08470 [Pseudoalteromonas elyakovii]|jgi:hypothetical protein|uniref:hypothetical protein n=1 Tax=Pseudoalteromonas TaxID=53246 RepID=UPI0022B0EA51|nr:hypothetical protein [Pseudoalteromonas shioyasakiensis]MCZ4252352.1 hypothetical protein [Pseudoalteromonas shioyasakiensis]MDC3189771.1 hypothetical protein [Pseudoalteromonas elyakovii]|tara:strand:+ start:602 stop:901 length:300 start_codon:yes stop_codon:yes gene_type:complete